MSESEDRARPGNVPDKHPELEAVGDSEPCDWCGRPGIVEQGSWWSGDTLECRNPSLCRVCSFWLHQPGDVIEAMYEAELEDYDEIMQPFEQALLRRWREKVAQGKRRPQQAGERTFITSTYSWIYETGEDA
jgi:hypothetical protein